MKRYFNLLFALAAVAVLSVSCRKVVHSEVRALIDEVNDSVMVAKIDGSEVHFDIRNTHFTNGAVMYGDSAIVSYVGDLSEKRAVAESVYLLVRRSLVIPMEEDSTKELQTRPEPMSAEEVKAIDDMKKAFNASKKQ